MKNWIHDARPQKNKKETAWPKHPVWYTVRLMRELSLLSGLLLAIILTVIFYNYNTICDEVCKDTLRLHIVANSDSAADQALKLQVRDALLAAVSRAVEGAQNKDQAAQAVQAALPALRLTAQTVLQNHGSEQQVAVRVVEQPFASRDYGSFLLPGGRYTALRVELGAAKGHNWFCVLYPELCVGSTQAQYDKTEENAVVFGRYQVRFAMLDATRGLWNGMKGRAEKSLLENLLHKS